MIYKAPKSQKESGRMNEVLRCSHKKSAKHSHLCVSEDSFTFVCSR